MFSQYTFKYDLKKYRPVNFAKVKSIVRNYEAVTKR